MNKSNIDSFESMTLDELYRRLKPIASNLMREQPATHTLQVTALVNEFLVRMQQYLPQLDGSAAARRAVARQAGTAMRRLLIDHARYHGRAKRTGAREREGLDEHRLRLVDGDGHSSRHEVDLEAIDNALGTLRVEDPEAATIVEGKFFGGMTMRQIAETRGETDDQAVQQVWTRAKTRLRELLRSSDDSEQERETHA